MENQHIKDAVSLSIAAAGSEQSVAINTLHARKAKWFIKTSGADCTATPQFSMDGTTWISGTAYTAAATGGQAVIELPGPYVRLSVANGGGGTQALTADLLIEPLV